MLHQPSNLLTLGGLLTSMAGVFLLAYAPALGIRGYRKLETFFFLIGLLFVFAGIGVLIANYQK